MVFGVAPLSDVSTLTLKVDAGGIEECQGQIGKEVPLFLEEFFFHEVFRAPRRKRGGEGLVLFRQYFTEPCHGTVEMVEVEIADALDAVLLLPFLGRAVGTGLREAVEDGEENRPLHGELEPSFPEKAGKYRVHAGCFPETTEYQGDT